MAKRGVPNPDDEAWKLAEHVTKYVNNAFGRKLRTSRALYDAVVSALDSGYSDDEIRLAYWSARCIAGDAWLKNAIQRDLSPDIVLRHKGGTNPKTNAPAKRWLDEMVSRASEMNPVLVGGVLLKLPAEMHAGERDLLTRMGVVWEERQR